MSQLICIYIGGLFTLIVAVYHTQLSKKLNWAVEFKKIATHNAKTFYTINLALTILFFIIGFISFIYAKELSRGTGLAFGFNLSYSGFWIWRFFWQVTYQRPNKYQKPFQVGVAKILVPVILASCYLWPPLSKLV